jgi:hypothetical protein
VLTRSFRPGSLALGLGNRYEELNLLYGIDDALNLNSDAPLHGLVLEALQSSVDFIDIDAAGVWAPRYGLFERAFADVDSTLRPLSDDNFEHKLASLVRDVGAAVVLNGAVGDPLVVADYKLPYRVIAAPIAQGPRAVAGVLTFARAFSNGPFTNSDRKLAQILAAEIGKALDQRFDAVTGLMNRDTFEGVVLAQADNLQLRRRSAYRSRPIQANQRCLRSRGR